MIELYRDVIVSSAPLVFHRGSGDVFTMRSVAGTPYHGGRAAARYLVGHTPSNGRRMPSYCLLRSFCPLRH